MGKRGPPPTPTAILQTRNSWRAKKAEREGPEGKVEPKPEPGRPACPRWLSPAAKKVWKELIPLLDGMRVLARIDRFEVARYCQLWARWRECEEFILENGTTFPIFGGEPGEDGHRRIVDTKAYPQVRVANQLCSELGRLAREFGLTPSARTRILVDETRAKETATSAGGNKRHVRLVS